jgi:pimeloyl-ACP methyl ester carboxylesterase
MTDTPPTVVLVHGAFADASSFARVIHRLLADGIPVRAPAVPNRSLTGDAAYIASVIRQIPGPVVLVGHSYGGAVITVAGVEDNVKALVYLSAYALDEGESLGELSAAMCLEADGYLFGRAAADLFRAADDVNSRPVLRSRCAPGPSSNSSMRCRTEPAGET